MCAWLYGNITITWMVKIVLSFSSSGLLLLVERSVETVHGNDDHLFLGGVHLMLAQGLHDLATYC